MVSIMALREVHDMAGIMALRETLHLAHRISEIILNTEATCMIQFYRPFYKHVTFLLSCYLTYNPSIQEQYQNTKQHMRGNFLTHSHQDTHTRLTDYSRELQYRLNPVSWAPGNVGMDHKTERADYKTFHGEIACL